MSDDTTINVAGLESLLKALKQKAPVARVGILGDSPRQEAPHVVSGASIERRTKGTTNGPTNAEIGAAHEYGTNRVPQRSFLRVPITDNLQKYMENSGALDEDTMKAVIKSGTVTPWLKKVSALAKTIVLDAFDTGGFGKWASWKSGSYTNNTGNILVDTTQLRDSITDEVSDG